ncbi:hypothetical protein GA0115240_14773, partial [Streptomyces sp. DvalAA-14]
RGPSPAERLPGEPEPSGLLDAPTPDRRTDEPVTV